MTILLYLLLLTLGLAMISFGAHYLTSGAVAIADRYHVPPLIIGLTIVGFGTSAPELVVSLTAAISGKTDIAIANVVGSNIANILLILGVSAIIYPMSVTRIALKRDIPFAILVTILCLVMASDRLFGGDRSVIDRVDGIVLLSLMLFYLYMTFMSTKAESKKVDANISNDTTTDSPMPLTPVLPVDLSIKHKENAVFIFAIVKVVVGLACLILGGRLFVDNASSIARAWGVSDAIIGLTIVAVGTSLPELATSIVAAVRHHPDLAIGNVVGSNIFNILFILGTSALISPLPSMGVQIADYVMTLISVLMLFAFCNLLGRSELSRREGWMLLVAYLGYMSYLIYNAI